MTGAGDYWRGHGSLRTPCLAMAPRLNPPIRRAIARLTVLLTEA
jgi:hypothetical protein